MGPCRYTFRRTAATRRYHQSFWTGAFSVFTPVRANGAHSGGLILPSACSLSLRRSIKRTGGTSYAVVIRNTRRFALHKSRTYLKACVLSRRAPSPSGRGVFREAGVRRRRVFRSRNKRISVVRSKPSRWYIGSPNGDAWRG